MTEMMVKLLPHPRSGALDVFKDSVATANARADLTGARAGVMTRCLELLDKRSVDTCGSRLALPLRQAPAPPR